MHPATDLFMMGAVYGDIVAVHRDTFTVKLDRLRKPVRVKRKDVLFVD